MEVSSKGTVLLTGAAGFVGSHLSDRLLGEGWDVIGVDSFMTGRRENVAHLKANPRFTLIEHDVCEPLRLPTSTPSLSWVLHFASPASPPKYLAAPIDTLRVNSEGTRHLLELARTQGAKFFFASTSEVYGDPQIHPQVESYWGNVNPNGIRSVYDEAKRYGEAIVMAYHRKFGLSTRLIRIFNTYGPRMDPFDGRVVTNLLRQALSGQPLTVYGAGEQTRSFQFVTDLVDGIVRLMGVEYSSPVNLGNPEEYKVIELAEIVKKLCKSSSEFIYEAMPEDDPKQRRPDITLARQLLGWEPHVTVNEGLKRTLDYFLESRAAWDPKLRK
jgi:dTDP-glucose 4,6-dehydratase